MNRLAFFILNLVNIKMDTELWVLVDGKWHDVWYDTTKSGGRFVREDAGFRDWVKNDLRVQNFKQNLGAITYMYHLRARGRTER